MYMSSTCTLSTPMCTSLFPSTKGSAVNSVPPDHSKDNLFGTRIPSSFNRATRSLLGIPEKRMPKESLKMSSLISPKISHLWHMIQSKISELVEVQRLNDADAQRQHILLHPSNKNPADSPPEPDRTTPDPKPTDAFVPEVPDDFNNMGSRYYEAGNVQYWYNMSHDKCSLYLSETHVSLRHMIKQSYCLCGQK